MLDADLHWRNPEGYLELHRRVRRFIVAQLQQARAGPQRAFFDLLYLSGQPRMRAYYDWAALARPTRSRPTRRTASRAGHGGPPRGRASARIAEYWWRRPARGLRRLPRHRGQLVGFILSLALDRASPADLEADPAVAAAGASSAVRPAPPR